MNKMQTALAAQQMLDALDIYEVKFAAMVSARMEAAAYNEVSAVMETIRAAKLHVFQYVMLEWSDFLTSHGSLMTALWEVELARLRGTAVEAARALPAITRDHEDAITRLREACEKLADGSDRGNRKPPAAPSAGY